MLGGDWFQAGIDAYKEKRLHFPRISLPSPFPSFFYHRYFPKRKKEREREVRERLITAGRGTLLCKRVEVQENRAVLDYCLFFSLFQY